MAEQVTYTVTGEYQPCQECAFPVTVPFRGGSLTISREDGRVLLTPHAPDCRLGEAS